MFWLPVAFNKRYSQAEIDRIEAWARRERAEAVQGLFASLARGLWRAPAKAYAGIQRRRRKRAAYRELNHLSDHVLRDIGLSRGQIPEAVETLLRQEAGTLADGRHESAAPRRGLRVVKTTGARPDSDEDWQRAA